MLKEFVPQEGDLVRIHVANSVSFPRNYMLVIWPKPNLIPKSFTQGDDSEYISHVPCNFIINMEGHFSPIHSFGFKKEDKFVRPTVNDIFEISRTLRENGMIYNRKTKQLISLNNNESNR